VRLQHRRHAPSARNGSPPLLPPATPALAGHLGTSERAGILTQPCGGPLIGGMMMDAIFERFVAGTPTTVMAQLGFERVLDPAWLDQHLVDCQGPDRTIRLRRIELHLNTPTEDGETVIGLLAGAHVSTARLLTSLGVDGSERHSRVCFPNRSGFSDLGRASG
jgi:hypothetical protein